MHTCPQCGKAMATAGGLEVHGELYHTAPVPVPEPAPTSVPLEPASVSRPTPTFFFRPSMGLNALLTVCLLMAGIAIAVNRSGSSKSTLDTVRAAATRTTDATTARMSATVKSEAGPFAKGLTEEGGFDFGARRARIYVDPSSFGIKELSGKIEAVADFESGFIIYMHFPQLTSELGGKQWLKMDIQELAKQSGLDVDFNSIFQSQSNDPTSGLRLLQGAEEVSKVGTEQLRGVETTHYHLVVNVDRAAEQASPGQRDAMRKLASLYTVKSLPADVWLDAQNRVRRMQMSIDPSTIRFPAQIQDQVAAVGRISIDMQLYDFGAPVDVNLPPADDVADLGELLRQAE